MKQPFFIYYVILVAAQMLICNFFRFTPWIMLSILPVLVLCIPTRYGTTTAMLIAFATGLTVDFLAEGLAGINTLALVPVALSRRFICDSIFGTELTARGEDFSFRKYGAVKVIFAILLVQALFLAIYIWADGAEARPLLFSLGRFTASLGAGVLVSIPIAEMITPDDRK